MDVIEDMSLEIKQSYFFDDQRTMPNLPEATGAEELAEQHRLLFCPAEDQEEEVVFVHLLTSGHLFSSLTPLHVLFFLLQVDSHFPNLNEINFYMEQAGVGLGRMEMQRIFLAVKQLAYSEQLPHCRLWGKILGIESNYIIAEAAYKEGEEDEEQKSEEMLEEEEIMAEHHENENEVRI